MAILDALQSAAVRLTGIRPSVFFTSSERYELELCDMLNDVAADIHKYNDWQNLYNVYNIPIDGKTDVFDLPADYDRMITTAGITDPHMFICGFPHIVNINDFMLLKNGGYVGLFGKAWTIYKNQIHFTKAPDSEQAIFPYISRNYAVAQNGAEKPAFTEDTDTFLIANSDRLLTLGLVWRWRENKKLDFTGDQENFMTLLDQIAGKDKGSDVYRRTSRTRFFNAYYAWPFQLG